MSRASKTTLAVTTALCGGVVWFVHYFQRAEKEVCPSHFVLYFKENIKLMEIGEVKLMHAGVIRDEERSRTKRERQLDFDMQRELEKEFKKSQSVSPVNTSLSTDGVDKHSTKG